ncbi:MAG TPA: hypothetical protein VFU23_09750 [Gemmatimonadales bacterium]|nr:hypothetical protein [Gemmatimonadales bacterium]
MTGHPTEVNRPRPAAIFSPVIDLLCVGGLSIVVLVPLLLSGREQLDFVGLSVLAWAQILLNMSHFMASYRIVYRDKAMVLRHRWATIGVPVLLVLYILVAIRQAQFGPPLLMGLLVLGSSCYLAWHYTGQVFGMMASYAWLEGIRYQAGERWLIRASLRLLLAWHVVWAVHIWFTQTAVGEPAWVEPLYLLVSAGGILALGLGAAGLAKVRLRAGRWPPAQAVVAWLAIFVWYLALARWGLAGLFLVQLAHALQYLEFPARVELNRAHRVGAGGAATHMLIYAAVLLAVSVLVGKLVPGAAMSSVATLVGNQSRNVIPVLFLSFINVHHYFTDGVIWKISNPEVRKDLFAHIGEPATVATAPAPRPARKRKR